MLDLDFLAALKSNVRQHAVYKYTSGSLKTPVVNKLQHLYAGKNLLWQELPFDQLGSEFYTEGLLGNSAFYCEYPADAPVKAQQTLTNILADLTVNTAPNSLILIVPAMAPFLGSQAYQAFAAKATALEEPSSIKHSLTKFIDYTATAAQAVYDWRLLTNLPNLKSALEHYVTDEMGVPEVREILDFTALLCVDLNENKFSHTQFSQYFVKQKPQFYVLHEAIAHFLKQEDLSLTDQLVALFEKEFFDHFDIRMLYGLLHKVTRDLLIVNSTLNPRGELPEEWTTFTKQKLTMHAGLKLRNLYKWQLALLWGEPILNDFERPTLPLRRICYRWHTNLEQAVGPAGRVLIPPTTVGVSDATTPGPSYL